MTVEAASLSDDVIANVVTKSKQIDGYGKTSVVTNSKQVDVMADKSS